MDSLASTAVPAKAEEANAQPQDYGATAKTTSEQKATKVPAADCDDEQILRNRLVNQEERFGPDDARVAVALHSLARNLLQTQEGNAEGLSLMHRALEIWESKKSEEAGGDAIKGGRKYDGNADDNDGDDGDDSDSDGRIQGSELRHIDGVFDRALAKKEAELGSDHVGVAVLLHKQAEWKAFTRREKEAEQLLKRALAIKQSKLGPQDVRVSFTWCELGLRCLRGCIMADGWECFREALEIQEATLGPDSMQVAFTLLHMGLFAEESGRFGDAKQLLRRALAIQDAKLEPDNLLLEGTLHELGMCLRQGYHHQRSEEVIEAEMCFRRALDIKEAKCDPRDHLLNFARHELAVAMMMNGRVEEAGRMFRLALEIESVIYQTDPWDSQIWMTTCGLALCEEKMGRHDEAAALWGEALHLVQSERTGPCHRPKHCHHEVATTSHQLALTLRAAGRAEEALECLKRVLEIKQRGKLRSYSPTEAILLENVGVCALEAGRPKEEAEGVFQRALEIKKDRVAKVLMRLSECVKAMGRPDDGDDLTKRALELNPNLAAADDEKASMNMLELPKLALMERCARESDDEKGRFLKATFKRLEGGTGASDPSLLALILQHTAELARKKGCLEDAEGLLRQALKIEEGELAADHPPSDIVTPYALSEYGREGPHIPEHGEAYARQEYEAAKVKFGADDVQTGSALYSLAICALEVGKPLEAETMLRRAVEIHEAKLGSDHPKLVSVLRALADALREAGRPEEEAAPFQRRAQEIRDTQRN